VQKTPVFNHIIFTGFLLIAVLLYSKPLFAIDFENSVEAQIRTDHRSNKQQREQYRLRLYSELFAKNDKWSLNFFGSTGEDFASSHNSLETYNETEFHLRRAYVRYRTSSFRTELGVIPTYKGHVSSSGLSKDGFIKGLRNVFTLKTGTELEIVMGSINETKASLALGLPNQLDYVEFEFSRRKANGNNFELSLERMTKNNFIRTEFSGTFNNNQFLFFEVVNKLGTESIKFVVGTEFDISLFQRTVSSQFIYSYVSSGFGQRAELTEDFISTGHGLSIEAEVQAFSGTGFDVFTRFDVYKKHTRWMMGLKYKY